MPATPEDILVDAYAKSKANQPGSIAAESTELLGVINRTIRKFYSIGSMFNPYFFADTDDVSYGSPGWERPDLAEAVFRIELPTGVQVVVVPFDHRTAEALKPAVYRWGQYYRSAGNASDPTNEVLTIFFSKIPANLTALDEEMDSMFPAAFMDLINYEVALYLAVKDRRPEEIETLKAARDEWLLLFLAFLEHETVGEVGSRARPAPFNTPSLIPLGSLLNGGTSVEL